MAADLALILLLATGFLLGFVRGAIRQLLGYGAWLVSFLLAAYLSPTVGGWLQDQSPQFSSEYANMLAFGLLFLLLMAASLAFVELSGATITLTRHALLDDIIGGLLGLGLVLLIASAAVIIFDTYHTLPELPQGEEVAVIRDSYQALADSAIANGLRDSLIPLIGTLLGPLLPAEVRAVTDR
jgi:membrane protein required for colicin V production